MSVNEIYNLLAKAKMFAPLEFPKDLPTRKELLGNSDWYDFEIQTWNIGENIRQLFVVNPTLRKNKDILDKILEIIKTVNLRRGRQSFVLLLGFVGAKPLAPELVDFLEDKDIDGHILDTLLKMKAGEYTKQIKPLLNSNATWIKNLAKKYCERYPN